MSEVFVEVLLDQNLTRALDYRAPKELHIEVGMRVEVPLKNTIKKGTISKIKNNTFFQNVKPIHSVLSTNSELSQTLWNLAHWMSKYYASPMQRVLRCFIPVNVRKNVEQKLELFITLNISRDECVKEIEKLRIKAPKSAETLEKILHEPKGVFLSDLDVSRHAVQSLAKKGLIKLDKIVPHENLLIEEEFFKTNAKKLNDEQKSCLEAIEKSISEEKYQAHLIYGVTGSGKTEVYMQAIQKALDLNKSAILLVPEVALTSQTIERLKSRFYENIAILHHKRSLGERSTAWNELKTGKAKLVIGARSAIFCPIQNLGLIIVDEEHDSSYKQQEESPCYHGRDVAVMRAYLEKCCIVLGSATPSLESMQNAKTNKYLLHQLTSRATSQSMPEVQIIDMKEALSKQGGFSHFSEPLIKGIKQRIDLGEQVLLFLNKRGYHRMQICSSCRHIVKCPHCDLALTFHKTKTQTTYLQCHLCDFKQTSLRACPNCNCQDTLVFKGFGTEHVERSLHALFPDIRTLRMDRDTTQKKNSHEDLFKQFRAHKADVLIGTQMIAKGFHFPSVTLVAVLNADSSLCIPDFRASEYMFQLLTQVAGRAGRDQLKGQVLIQTFLPEHPLLHLAAKQDYLEFFQKEIEERKTFLYPPFCHLVKLLFQDKNEDIAKEKAEKAFQYCYEHLKEQAQVLPVNAAGYPKIKDEYRFQFLIKTIKISTLTDVLHKIEGAKIDVDPLSTFF